MAASDFILDHEGRLIYDFEVDRANLLPFGERPELNGWRAWLGPHYFHTVVGVVKLQAFSDDDLDVLLELPRLKYIDLGDCTKITDRGVAKLRALRHVKELRLARNNREGDDFWAHNRITDDTLSEVSQMQSLEQLLLDEIAFSDDGLEHLKSLRRLRILLISSPLCTSAAIEVLQRELPNCNIDWRRPRTEYSRESAVSIVCS